MELIILERYGHALYFTNKTQKILWDSTSFYPNIREKVKTRQRVIVEFGSENLHNG